MATTDPCLRCGTAMDVMGVTTFRTGGMRGPWSLFLSGWADLREDLLPLGILVCGSCGYVELRVPESLPADAEETPDAYPGGPSDV